jgi:hypothetical protein
VAGSCGHSNDSYTCTKERHPLKGSVPLHFIADIRDRDCSGAMCTGSSMVQVQGLMRTHTHTAVLKPCSEHFISKQEICHRTG